MDDDSDNEWEEDECLYVPCPGDGIEEMVQKRVPLGAKTTTTGLTAHQGWIKSWTTFMAIRELIQNFMDHMRFRFFKEMVVLETRGDGSGWEPWKELVHQSRCIPASFMESGEGFRFFCVMAGKYRVGNIVSGHGIFIIAQHNSTLSMDCLYMRSTKHLDPNMAGTHGCGMKEGALLVLTQGGRMKMWMPANAADSLFPGEAWTWKLSCEGIMKVRGSPLKTYKERTLLTAFTHLPPDFAFDPTKFLMFKICDAPKCKFIDAPMRQPMTCPLDYRILLDRTGIYNYGIFVQEHELTTALGIGLDGRYKLADRYRTKADDVKRRLAAAIKVAVRRDAVSLMPHLINSAMSQSLAWIFPKHPRLEDSMNNHGFRDLPAMLTYGILKCDTTLVPDAVVLAGAEWTPEERGVAKALGYSVFNVYDRMHGYEDRVIFPAIKKQKASILPGSVGASVQHFFVSDCGMGKEYAFCCWQVDLSSQVAAAGHLRPFYILGKEVILTVDRSNGTFLVEEKELCMRLLSRLLSDGCSRTLLDKAFSALQGRCGAAPTIKHPMRPPTEETGAFGSAAAADDDKCNARPAKRSRRGDDGVLAFMDNLKKSVNDISSLAADMQGRIAEAKVQFG